MNLHEYQSKKLFSDYQIPVPEGVMIEALDDLEPATKTLGGEGWAVKAQVHAGGRGKAGGVKICQGLDKAKDAASKMLGQSLVTHQTDDKGMPINRLLIESLTDIANELYLSLLVDRATRRITVMVSTEGGMNIEEVADQTPEKILTEIIDPIAGFQPYVARNLAFALGLEGQQIRQFTTVLASLVKLFIEKDVSLLEINPLVVTGEGNLMALDAKINFDDNALYRHPDIVAMRDPSQEDEREGRASEFELNYIHLDGDIGCMVNGAGLAMATMDLIKLHGGEPANFLDVGGGATAERVAEAFKIILSDPNVKGILVNIFGGIVRCDLIAEGIIQAVNEVEIGVPVVVRLEGTNASEGKALLDEGAKSGGLNIIAASTLADAADKIVEAAGGNA
ncbi:MAG TPA: ADP-forming succinate--CoA ligase subunit beta [Leucothrix sp.]|nr:ADP-forming succinate--CoA ligase subunit beta [Leucothrix sp.]